VTAITLDLGARFLPYGWQLDVIKARRQGIRNIALALHRGAGKTSLMLQLLAEAIYTEPGTYAIVFPYATTAAKAVWRESDDDGVRLMERHFPLETRLVTREQEKSIEFFNGSVLYLVSAEEPRSLVGTNVKGIVYDEAAKYADNEMPMYNEPRLVRNGGWQAYISTFEGTNWFYELVRHNRDNPAWYVRELTIRDTEKHDGAPIITNAQIDQLRAGGTPESWIQQEYFCSPVASFSGAYYANMMRRAREEGRVGEFPWNPNEPVLAAFDIGYSDHTIAGFFQALAPNKTVFIGSRAWQFVPPAEIARDIKADFPWGNHVNSIVLPWDAAKPGPSGDTWVTVFDKFKLAKDEITVLRKGSGTLHAEIAHVQQNLATCYFDNARRAWTGNRENNLALLEALASYRTELIAKRGATFSRNPLHNEASHYADMMRYALVFRHGDYMPGGWSKSPDWSKHDRAQTKAWGSRR
jgi:hypothetical protein